MPTITLGDLDTSVLSRLDNNDVLYTQAERYAAINEALRVANLITGFHQTRVTAPYPTQANRIFYRVPAGIIVPMSVYLDKEPLFPAGTRSVASTDSSWIRRRSDRGRPPVTWIPLGIRMFAINPPDAQGGRLITVAGVGEPPLLTAAAETTSLPDEYVDMVEDLAFHRLPMKVGGKEFLDQTPIYRGVLSKAKQYRKWSSWKAPRFWIEVSQERQ